MDYRWVWVGVSVDDNGQSGFADKSWSLAWIGIPGFGLEWVWMIVADDVKVWSEIEVRLAYPALSFTAN